MTPSGPISGRSAPASRLARRSSATGRIPWHPCRRPWPATRIYPSCDAKKYLKDPLATFVAGTDAEVYVAHDDRVTIKPAWLTGWVDSGLDVVDNEASPVTYSLFKKALPPVPWWLWAITAAVPGAPSTSSSSRAPAVRSRRGSTRVAGQPAGRLGRGFGPAACVVRERRGGAHRGQRPPLPARHRRVAEGNRYGGQAHGDGSHHLDPTQDPIPRIARSTIAPPPLSSGTWPKFTAPPSQNGSRKRSSGALDYLLAAQYPNGGWPQYYPNTSAYYARHHFQRQRHGQRAQPPARSEPTAKAITPSSTGIRRDKAAHAVQKGIDCILRCQVRVKGELTAWCAQHDEKTLAPAPARAYELVSLSGSESVGLVRFLMSIETPATRRCSRPSSRPWIGLKR